MARVAVAQGRAAQVVHAAQATTGTEHSLATSSSRTRHTHRWVQRARAAGIDVVTDLQRGYNPELRQVDELPAADSSIGAHSVPPDQVFPKHSG